MVTFKTYRKRSSLCPSKISFDDLQRICHEALEIRNSTFTHEETYLSNLYGSADGEIPETRESNQKNVSRVMREIRNNCIVLITVRGSNGELFTIIPTDRIDDVFSSITLPPKVESIKFENWSNYQMVTNNLPKFRFTIELDFTDCTIWSNQYSQDANGSFVEVSGLSETWALGTFEKLKKAVERRPATISNLVHRHLKYEVLLWLVGTPSSILLLSRFSSVLLPNSLTAVQCVAYLGLTLFNLNLFRSFFNYLRWLFPFLELDEQPKKMQTIQRTFAAFIAAGIISGWLSLFADAIWHWK